MAHKCSAYLDVDVLARSNELAGMFILHPTPAAYAPEFSVPGSTADEKFSVSIVVFATSHPTPANPVDATAMDTATLIALIATHDGPSAVQMTVEQASAVYNVLHVPEQEPI